MVNINCSTLPQLAPHGKANEVAKYMQKHNTSTTVYGRDFVKFSVKNVGVFKVKRTGHRKYETVAYKHKTPVSKDGVNKLGELAIKKVRKDFRAKEKAKKAQHKANKAKRHANKAQHKANKAKKRK